MDLLAFINHLQKKVRSGGATKRVHGIGQGHETNNTAAVNPSADAPTDAPAGYMNADLLDGFHAKQKYQTVVPGTFSGINADQLDGVDKSLGHFSSASTVITRNIETPGLSAIYFKGSPAQNDQISIEFFNIDGTSITTSSITLAAGTAINTVRDTLKTQVSQNATLSEHFNFVNAPDSDNFRGLGIISKLNGPKANLYLCKVTLTRNGGSTLECDASHGIYRFYGGGPAEGINADKLDDFHAKEPYHGLTLDAADGLNSDTLDSFHAREAYGEIEPPAYTGINADTLDGVHKLKGHRITVQDLNNFGTTSILLSNSGNSAANVSLTLELFNLLDSHSVLGSHTFTYQGTETADNIGSSIKDYFLQSPNDNLWFYLKEPVWNPNTNILQLTAKWVGERNRYYVKITINDPNTAQGYTPLTVKISGSSDAYSSTLIAKLVPPNSDPLLGVDADMLDSIHADSGHFGTTRLIDGHPVTKGINADMVDGLHARTASPNNPEALQTVLNNDGTVNVDYAYIPVADGERNHNLFASGLIGPSTAARWQVQPNRWLEQGGGAVPIFYNQDKDISQNEWSWMIKPTNPNTIAFNPTTWNTATPAERGALRWHVNPNVYTHTEVDYADLAGAVDWNNVNYKPSVVTVNSSGTSRRLYTYTVRSLAGQSTDLFMHVPGAPLLITIRNANTTWNSEAGVTAYRTGNDYLVSNETPNYANISFQDQENAYWDNEINGVIQDYKFESGKIGVFTDHPDEGGVTRTYLVISHWLFDTDQDLIVTVII